MTETMTHEKAPKNRLSRTEKSSWAVGLGGQNILFGLQLSFILFAFVTRPTASLTDGTMPEPDILTPGSSG